MAHDQILSLCSGIGGLDLGFVDGLRSVGGSPRIIGMVEREAFCVATLVAQMRARRLDECPVWLGDLRDLPVKELPAIDWITGGYPCQPFSAAGKRLGEDDPRHLWPVILDFVRTLRPRGVFFENVAGHLTLGLDRVLRDLAESGFRCAFGLFTAEEVGAPHRRERVFILGISDDPSTGCEAGWCDPGDCCAEDCVECLADRDGRRLEGCRATYDEDRDHAYRDDARRRDSDLADGERERLEGHSRDESGPTGSTEWEDRPVSACRLRRGTWQAVLHADECAGEREDGSLECDCGIDYVDCCAPGPTEDGFDYRTIDGRLFARWNEWPTRPGEVQHEWEPPRTIEPDVGRDAHGIPSRVDRLRGLGNAVVPAQAERAFVTLYREVAGC